MFTFTSVVFCLSSGNKLRKGDSRLFYDLHKVLYALYICVCDMNHAFTCFTVTLLIDVLAHAIFLLLLFHPCSIAAVTSIIPIFCLTCTYASISVVTISVVVTWLYSREL